MTLQDACIQFLEAREEIMKSATAPGFAVIHNGRAAFFKVDPASGVGVAVHDCLGSTTSLAPPAAETKAETPAAPDKPKRGRPAKAQEIETKSAEAPAVTAPAADAKVEWTNDKLRALARSVKDKIGLEKTRELIGAQIDDLKPEQYAATAAKLQAKLDEVAAPKPEEL